MNLNTGRRFCGKKGCVCYRKLQVGGSRDVYQPTCYTSHLLHLYPVMIKPYCMEKSKLGWLTRHEGIQGAWRQDPLILNLETRWRWAVSRAPSTHWPENGWAPQPVLTLWTRTYSLSLPESRTPDLSARNLVAISTVPFRVPQTDRIALCRASHILHTTPHHTAHQHRTAHHTTPKRTTPHTTPQHTSRRTPHHT